MPYFGYQYCVFMYNLTNTLCFPSLCESKKSLKKKKKPVPTSFQPTQINAPNSALVRTNRVRYEGKSINKHLVYWKEFKIVCIFKYVYGEVCKGLYDYFLRFSVNKRKFRSKS